MLDDFIGYTFLNYKNNLMRVVGKNPNRVSIYYVTCDVCSLDTEMFPAPFEVTKSQITTMKQTPCGCAKIPKWSELQWSIRVTRECNTRTENIVFLGWDGGFAGSKTRLKLKNLDNGCSWSPNINKFLYSKQGDPKSGLLSRSNIRSNRIIDVITKIEDIMSAEGCGRFKNFPNGYKNNSSKFSWVCRKGHNCETRYSNFVSLGRRCRVCNNSGFNVEYAGLLYLVRWFNEKQSYLKFGITNQEVLQRIIQQSRKSHLDYEILHTFYHESGQRVYDCERSIKQSMQTGVCPKELLPDGYTETILDSQENIDTVLAHINDYLT